MRSIFFAALLTAVALIQAARADGLIYQLPDDGGQVRYDMAITLMVDSKEQNIKGSVTVSSVGQVTVEDEKCRWIEIKMISITEGQEQPVTTKMLIPEKHLGKGKSPADHLIRVWLKDGDAEAQEIKDFKALELLATRAFLAGPLKNPGELEKIEIDGKLGKLPCAGATGDQEFEFGTATLGINYENRLHEKSPFGVVAANWKIEIKNNGQALGTGTFKLTLTDTSNTALTELPDKK